MRFHAGESRGGFTLLELLMVIAIIGVVTAIISPRIGTAMGGGKLRIGTRSVIQTARYARAMALLHQIDVDLVFDLTPDNAKVRVEAAPLSGERTDGGATGRIDLGAKDDESGSDTSAAPENGAPFSGVKAMSFEGYTDTRDTSSKGMPSGEETEARVHFNSNGTCRPFAVKVSITEDDALYVMFDILGSAKVSEEAPR